MSIYVEWDEHDSRIIHHIMEDPWDWTEFYDAINQVKLLSQTTQLDIALIVDLSHTTHMPPSAISHYKRMAELLDDYIDIAVVTNGSRFYRTMFVMFKKLSKGPIADSYHWTTSNEEAYDLIRELRGQSSRVIS